MTGAKGFGITPATPSALVRDKARSPFNIGQAIELDGFTLIEVETLTEILIA